MPQPFGSPAFNSDFELTAKPKPHSYLPVKTTPFKAPSIAMHAWHAMHVKIIGSIDGSHSIDDPIIQQLLNCEQEAITHTGQFTGKPETRIHANNDWVLKASRSAYLPSLSVATKWCQLQIKKEQDYGIYHPQRTWIVLGKHNEWIIANISPRMQPLHQLNFNTLNANNIVQLLFETLNIYMTFTTTFKLRLDEGLSNFGLLDGRVWYLDDDIYPWDNFYSFSAMLGHWIRKSDSLAMHTNEWQQLGARLQPLLRSHSSDAEDIVHESIIDQFTGKQETFKIDFLKALRPTYKTTMAQQATGNYCDSEPIALIADIHANLPAFQSILNTLDSHGVQQYLILGDIVGYGPNPNECIELIQQRNMFCIRGNHDHYVAHNGDVRVAMGSMAKWVANWTIQQLSNDVKTWLAALPVRHVMNNWMAVHGSPIDKTFFNGYVYNMTSEKNLDHLKNTGTPICLHGHSHIQGIYALNKGQYLPLNTNKGDINLSSYEAALICPGSVGQPRTNATSIAAEAAIFYPEQAMIKMIATPYDINSVIADMKSHGFPEQLIHRLQAGC